MDLVVAAALALGIVVRLAFMEESKPSIAVNSEVKSFPDSAAEGISIPSSTQ